MNETIRRVHKRFLVIWCQGLSESPSAMVPAHWELRLEDQLKEREGISRRLSKHIWTSGTKQGLGKDFPWFPICFPCMQPHSVEFYKQKRRLSSLDSRAVKKRMCLTKLVPCACGSGSARWRLAFTNLVFAQRSWLKSIKWDCECLVFNFCSYPKT